MQSGLAPAAGDELPYRSVSSLAVLSLVLGLLSVTALTSPGAWLVPLPAALCAVWTLHRIRQRPDELLGRKAALAGLALALCFGCWAPARYFTDRWLINRQAREFMQQWFAVVFQGDLEAAHQATLNFYLRQPEGTLLHEFYQRSPDDLKELQTFFSQGIARDVADLGPQGRVRFERNLGLLLDRNSCQIVQRFLVLRDGQAQPVAHAQVKVARDEYQGVVYWVLLGLADAERMDERPAGR